MTTQRSNRREGDTYEPQAAYLCRMSETVKHDASTKAAIQGLSLNLVIETLLIQWLNQPNTPQVSQNYQSTLSRPEYQAAIQKLAGGSSALS